MRTATPSVTWRRMRDCAAVGHRVRDLHPAIHRPGMQHHPVRVQPPHAALVSPHAA
jgi:hypothetical protein